MRSLSATDAAFAGFQLIGKRPGLVIVWSIVSLLFLLGIVLLVAAIAGGPIMSMAKLADGATPSTEQITALVLTLLPAILLILPLALIFNGVMVGGVSRAILRPDEPGFFYLRLGGDEMRLTLVLLVQALAGFGVNFVASMIQAFGTVGSIAATGGDMQNAGSSPIGLLLQLVTWAVLIFLNLKFCLALPQTFDKRSIDIFGSWTLTGGYFWPLFAAYLLCGVLCVMLFAVVAGIFVTIAVALGISLGLGAGQEAPNIPAIIALAGVGGLVYALVATVSNTAIYAIAPNAYRQIAGSRNDSAAVFA